MRFFYVFMAGFAASNMLDYLLRGDQPMSAASVLLAITLLGQAATTPKPGAATP
jgi:hypothetical protein